MLQNGIYIGKDVEVVITNSYILTFRKSHLNNNLESRFYINKGGKDYSLKGICCTSPLNTVIGGKGDSVEVGFHYDEIDIIHMNSDSMMEFINQPLFKMIENNKNEIHFIINKESYHAQLDEEFDESKPLSLPATKESLGKCLKEWNFGISEIISKEPDGTNVCLGVQINTEKHMYIFQIFNDTVYCRAARYATCNKGICFSQNFRQNNFDKEYFCSYMFEDNREANEPLFIEEDLFMDNGCNIGKQDIYWSIKTFTEDEITLYGCGGDVYTWKRPK